MPDLQVLTLCGDRFDSLTTQGLAHITRCSNLVELALDYNPLVNNELLKAIGSGLPLLKTLSLANSGTEQSIKGRGMSANAQLKHLEQLDVSSLAAIRAGCLTEIVDSFPLEDDLHLLLLDASSLAAIRAGCLTEIVDSCHLELLQLRNCMYLNDEGVSAIVKCTKLRHLNLSGSILITSDSVQQLIKAFPHNGKSWSLVLKLSLAKECDTGVNVHWEALSDLGDNLPMLRRVSYRDMHNTGDKLYADGSSHIDSMAFEDLCTFASELKELRMNECFKITDENMSMISRTMPDLQVLTLCGDRFDSLTTQGLAHITRCSNLVELALDYNPLVNNELLQAIRSGLPLLKTLSLANSGTDQSITGRGMSAIAQLKYLEQLDASSLAAIRSGCLTEIVDSCPLELLQLRNCMYLNDEGVSAIVKCNKLRHLDLSGSILPLPAITILVGGTAVDASRLSVRGSRIVVDFSGYSTIISMTSSQTKSNFKIGSASDVEDSDDEFESLTAQRSFYIDAVCGEDDSPIENEKELEEWALREARNLGLIGK